MKGLMLLCSFVPLAVWAVSPAADTGTPPVKVSFVQLADGKTQALRIQAWSTDWPPSFFLDCRTASYELWKNLAPKDYGTSSPPASLASPFLREPDPARDECTVRDSKGRGYQTVDLPLKSGIVDQLSNGFIVDISAEYQGSRSERKVSVSISKTIELLNGNPKMLRVASDIPVTVKPSAPNFEIAEKRTRLVRTGANLRNAQTKTDPVLKGRPCALPPPGTKLDPATQLALRGHEACPEPRMYGDVKFDLPKDANSFDYELARGLSAGEHQLSIPPSASALDPDVNPSGKVTIPSVPAQTKPKVNGTLSSNFGVGQLAVFQLTGTFSPLSAYVVDGTNWIWDPTLAVDVGLRSTASNNSITVASPFSRSMLLRRVPDAKTSDATTIPTYNNWANAPWYFLENVNLSVGPKLEMSQQFQQRNLLGAARLDFTFTRLEGTLAERTSMITKDLKTGDPNPGILKGVNWGFRLCPYLSSDFGGHPFSETVTNTKAKQSVVVPPFGIFRIIPGFQSEIDYRSASLILDESVLDLISEEQIGLVTATGVELRRIGGIQPHSKISFCYAVDPAKHYALSVTYEDGRQPPLFKYLDKTTAGVTITY